MLANKAYKYELKPNNKQETLLKKSCGVARFAYNWGLAKRKELYKTKQGKERYTNAKAQHKELVILKKSEFSWMYEVSKCAPQEALRHLDKAYENMYRRIKNHEKKIGVPTFKKKGEHDSFSLIGMIHVYECGIQLPRIGLIKTKESTSKFKGRILSATVSREADRWFCSLCVKAEIPNPNPIQGEIIGIDLGLNTFAVISNGIEHVHKDAPKPLKKKLKKLRRLSRQQSRKQKGSNNRKKANLSLARYHRKVKNTRNDFLNKFTTSLAKTKSVIIIEDLNVKGMSNKKRHLGRSISDVGWGEFRRELEYKTEWYGSRLIVIPQFYPSSKTCHVCGAINENLKLSDRTWICLNCGMLHDRDENASDTIRDCGIKILNTESLSSEINACGVDGRLPDLEAVDVETGNKYVCYK